MRCSECGGGCYKPECLPQFQEDRLRMWRANDGSRFSQALGREMPESRSERRRLEKEKGIEFISPGEHPSKTHRAMKEYNDAVKDGASHEEAESVAPWPQERKTKLADMVKKWESKGGTTREKLTLGS